MCDSKNIVKLGFKLDSYEQIVNQNLIKAVDGDNFKKVKELIDKHSFDVNKNINQNGDTLIFCIKSRRMLKLLISRGADINLKNKYEATALHYLICSDRYDLVPTLITNNANVNATDALNMDAIHLAVSRHQYDNITLLLTHNADPNRAGFSGMTPLYIAAQQGDFDIFKLLMNNGADIKTSNVRNNTLFHSIALGLNKYNKMCWLILEYLLEHTSKNKDWELPFLKNDNGKEAIEILEDPEHHDTWLDKLDKYKFYE